MYTRLRITAVVAFVVILTESLLSLAGAAPIMIDGMYVNTFGDPTKQALVFVHGGPGYNSYSFEYTTAQNLANRGYYVVVYDERGQGRSETTYSEYFNYRKYSDDLKLILDTLKITKPVLLGHSHGGIISLKFDEYYPHIVRKIALISTPVNFWGTIHAILENCSRRYDPVGASDQLTALSYVYSRLFIDPAHSDNQRVQMIAATFRMGGECGLYSVKNPTADAIRIRNDFRAHPLAGPLSGMTTAMPGFLRNEDYVHFNGVRQLAQGRDHFCAIYGDEDGLFNSLELGVIKNAIQSPNEPQRFRLISGASHDLFIDQQEEFFKSLKETCGLGL